MKLIIRCDTLVFIIVAVQLIRPVGAVRDAVASLIAGHADIVVALILVGGAFERGLVLGGGGGGALVNMGPRIRRRHVHGMLSCRIEAGGFVPSTTSNDTDT